MEAFLLPLLIPTPILHAVNPDPARLSCYTMPSGPFLIVRAGRKEGKDRKKAREKEGRLEVRRLPDLWGFIPNWCGVAVAAGDARRGYE